MAESWHPENHELLATAIVEAEADAPRLVYADWLEEHGDLARAEFIRTGCALADKSAADADYPDLIERRSLALAAIRMRKMKPALPPGIGFRELIPSDDDNAECSFHRGLPYFARLPSIERDARLTREHVQQMCAALPAAFDSTTLRGLYLYEPAGLRSMLADLLLQPALARCTALATPNLDPQVGSAPSLFELLAACRKPPKLTWLDTNSLSSDDLPVLEAPAFERLTRLDLGSLPLNAREIAQLAKRAFWRRLRRVSIGLNGRSAGAGLKALAEAPELHDLTLYDFPRTAATAWKSCTFPALARLVFSGNNPRAMAGPAPPRSSSPGRIGLAEVRSAPRLSALEFRGHVPVLEEFKALTAAAWWPQIHTLHVTGGLPPSAADAILRSDCAPRLRMIRLSYSSAGRHGALGLFDLTRLPSLSTLVLDQSFTREGQVGELVERLASADASRLRHLALNGAGMGDAGAKAIAANPTFRLKRLELTHCQLSEEAMLTLLAAPQLDGLQQLRLSGNATGVELATALCDPGVLPDLIDLDLPLVTNSAIYQQLRQARPALFF